jgi:quercetin 2,3-dioxygenase
MPAISADTVALPRIPTVDPSAADRSVVSVTTAPSGFEGEGFPVRRAFAGVDLRALDPFVHMDQMGEVDYAPGEPKAPPGIPTGGSRSSPTCSTAFSATRTPTAVAG